MSKPDARPRSMTDRVRQHSQALRPKPEADLWRPLSLAAGWASRAGFAPVSAQRRKGTVHLRGLAEGGATGDTIATLDEGMRPEFLTRLGTIAAGNQAAHVDVDTDGSVTVFTSGADWISLDGLRFRAYR